MGKKIDKTNAILGEMQSFYSDLYTSKNISDEKIENYLFKLVNLPKINNENILALELFPTYDECTEAVFLQSLKRDFQKRGAIIFTKSFSYIIDP